ncbi:leucyl aminopeptidase family protein [Paraliomyxa miuraensis]|uniref:leucyl aminopeptidase family protein n=1 Tax=Paraliomyxa miuraensis TaxID=376150 RepID=UPI00225B7C57|nr:leucyl aminopeptidase family protein [Paraliomyxa miuraensis]MCX4245631.1 leucyl aminopeptidase family protein [Paraliomyxa miuraensis]
MTDCFATRSNARTVPVDTVTTEGYRSWLKSQSKSTQAWLKSLDFRPDVGKVALCPGRDGTLARVVLGLGRAPDLWAFAVLRDRVPKGRYRYEGLAAEHADTAALAWALASYRYLRYRKSPPEADKNPPTLVWPAHCDRAAVQRTFEAIAMARDLINTPAGDLGPAELAGAVEDLAARHGATYSVIVGDDLLDEGYPAIHAVGRAATRPPCLAQLRWGDEGAPSLTLVGKGVCFDSGGLDLKNASGMKLMKKDMGGAASVLALAHMVMDAGLPLRLRLLVPAVENAVSGNAFRPGDVLPTRKGITVEVGNTDAEGRLILCDALAEAASEEPDLLIDFATLTGAARVALGTELPALFCNDDRFADRTLDAGLRVHDPLWRMPLHRDYRRHLDSKIADINNIANVGFGGAITAALFLQEFVPQRQRWAHVDTMAWNSSSRPGRPAGGEVFGTRAFFDAIRATLVP